MGMSRKNFIALAEVIRDMRSKNGSSGEVYITEEVYVEDVIEKLSVFCQEQNTEFNSSKFRAKIEA